jgi:hypothetical protein
MHNKRLERSRNKPSILAIIAVAPLTHYASEIIRGQILNINYGYSFIRVHPLFLTDIARDIAYDLFDCGNSGDTILNYWRDLRCP